MKVRKEVKEAMKELGIDRCRRGQLKPIGKILNGKDVVNPWSIRFLLCAGQTG